MEQRSFKDKRSPSKSSGTPKQRFKSPLFTNDERHPTSQGPTRDQPNDIPLVAGKVRSPRSTETHLSRKSESSVSGDNVFQDENALFPNTKGLAHSLPTTGHGNHSGKLDFLLNKFLVFLLYLNKIWKNQRTLIEIEKTYVYP